MLNLSNSNNRISKRKLGLILIVILLVSTLTSILVLGSSYHDKQKPTIISNNMVSNQTSPTPSQINEQTATPTPTPAPKIVDFVSEAEVRAAMNRNEKIAIGPKTIVTPAARDLAALHDTLVMHHRP